MRKKKKVKKREMGDLYVCNSAFHIDYVAKISIFTFAGIFLLLSLPYLSTPTLFSLIIIIIIMSTSQRVTHNFLFYRLLSTIVTCTDTYLKNAVFVNYLKKARTLL